MTPIEPKAKLEELLALQRETEWVEFKHNNTEPQLIGDYLSALSNSAALEGKPFGYIVWGIDERRAEAELHHEFAAGDA